MVNFPPLAPSCLWWTNFLKEFLICKETLEAVAQADKTLTSLKDLARFSLKEASGDIITLSIPLEGGGRQLRNPQKLNGLKISEHGEWRKNHMGAIEACLGKTPFFRYIEDPILKIIQDKKISLLRDFNIAIFRVLFSFLFENVTLEHIEKFQENRAIKERGLEIANNLDCNLSCLEAISRFGRETLLGLMAMKPD